VEICATIHAVKYIHKYIYKGFDKATVEITTGGQQQRDEIKEFLDACYISSSEACWCIFEFNMHAESPTVYRFQVHLPDQQLIYYNDKDIADEVLNQDNINKTQLTEWFAFNAKDQHGVAKDILYQDFPKKFSVDKKTKTWKERTRSASAIGRMYFASPAQGEHFYLRLLLTAVPGTTSFQFLCTFNREQVDSFRTACVQRGLLEYDNEWRQCLEEAGQMQTGSARR